MIAVASNSAVDSTAQLLLRLCAGSIDELPLSGTVDWERLLRLAQIHRVTPLLYSRLKSLHPASIPPSIFDQLHDAVQANAARALQLAGELRRLLQNFAEAGIPVIPFKGIVLAVKTYGDLSLRDAGDVDLLVHRRDIVRAADLLISLGHQPAFPTATRREIRYLSSLKGQQREIFLQSHCEQHLVYPPTGLNVDLHWAMSLREFAVSLDVEAMWTRAQTTVIVGRQMLTLSLEDKLIVLCLNGAKDYWRRLDRIVDIAMLMRAVTDMKWPLAFHCANSSGTARMLRVGLGLAMELLNVKLPEPAIDYVQMDPKSGRIIAEIGQRFRAGDHGEAVRVRRVLFDLRMRERYRDRLSYLIVQFRPGIGDWAAIPLPASLSFLHWIIRPFRLIARYALSTTLRGESS